MTTEDYVSFETAKLLKEMGFDADITTYRDDFIQHGSIVVPLQETLSKDRIKTPTLQMAMKWLRETHDLHIIAYPWKTDKEKIATHWCCKVYKSFNLLGCEKYTDETPKSYEQACESAIKYCLTELI